MSGSSRCQVIARGVISALGTHLFDEFMNAGNIWMLPEGTGHV